MTVQVEPFGVTPDGDAVKRFGLERGGVRVELIEYGASVTRVRAPDRAGLARDVVLGFATLAEYWHDPAHFGAVPGRFANRIARGRCALGGRDVVLPTNHGAHHLHGGERGFGRRVWRGEALDDGVRFEIVSEDGDAGYPGRLVATATYRLGSDSNSDFQGEGAELSVTFRAESDALTLVNLTQHAYFHLGDGGATTVEDHRIEIAADEVLEVDADGIPSGRRLALDDTPYDLRRPTRLGERLTQLAEGTGERGGFDHCFVLRGECRGGSRPAARVVDPRSGRTLEVRTDQPGLQLYTANGLDGHLASPDGIAYGRWHALCLEPQAFPDAPNHPDFPSALLEPGDVYVHHSSFRFGVEDS
jgi:aldose 1-epimerase